MKIAVPSDDKVCISKHFGRTKGFVIVEMQDKKIVNTEYKKNDFTGHAQGLHLAQNHEHEAGKHIGIFNAIGNCDVVIAGGMGKRLYDDFEQNKIDVYVTKEENIENALQMFMNDKLDNNSENCCEH